MFFNLILFKNDPELSHGTRIPSSTKNFGCPKVVPWDKNRWDCWDSEKISWTVPGFLALGVMSQGQKSLGCPMPIPALGRKIG